MTGRAGTGVLMALLVAVVIAETHTAGVVSVDSGSRACDEIHIVAEGPQVPSGDSEEGTQLLDRLKAAEELGIHVDNRNLFIELASRSLGAFLSPKMQLGEQDGLRGVFALEDIEEGEVLARVPSRYFLSSVASKGRMERILEVVKEEVFEKQNLLPGDWINVDYAPWEIQVLATLATIGIAEEGDTPEIVARLEREFQELDDETIAAAVAHAKEGRPFRYFEGMDDEEVAWKWFFLGLPPFSEYSMGKGPLLEMPSVQELSGIEKLAMDWAFPAVGIHEYANIDRRVFEYFSKHFYGRCFTVPGPTEGDEEEEVCVRQLSFTFFRYMCAVASRYCFSIGNLAAGQIGYVSLINHGYHEVAHWESSASEFLLRANNALSKGKEVLISYGGLSLRSSVFSYGFYDESEAEETSMLLPFAYPFEFGAAEEQLCTDAVLAGLAVLPPDRVAYFSYDIQLSSSSHAAMEKVEFGTRVADGARGALQTWKETVRLHPFQRRLLQCEELSAEVGLYGGGYLQVDSWRLLRILHASHRQFASLSPGSFTGKEVECKCINSALLLLEAELATGNPLSAYSNGDALIEAVEGMQDTIAELEELVDSTDATLPSNTDERRSHGILNALRVVNAEKKLLRNTITKLLDYEATLGCDSI